MSGNTPLPPQFIDSLAAILDPEQARELVRSLGEETPAAVRFNPFKLASPPDGEQVPWCRYGFYTGERRPVFTLDPLHHAGVYYVQEPSSMFIEHIVRQLFPEADGLRMLDACAAPGGKATLLSTLAGLEGLVVANEPVASRANILVENVKRWGLGNVAVTANDTSHYATVREFFDLILVDAPCSGEGMMRKNAEARLQWSPRNVANCAARQQGILEDLWPSLKPGGMLVYSTCTFNKSENEQMANWLAGNYDCENIPVDFPSEWSIARSVQEGTETYRFYPHRLKGEGFCVTVFRKAPGKVRTKLKPVRRTLLHDLVGRDARECARWLAQPEYMRFAAIGDEAYAYYKAAYPDVIRLSEALNVIYSGVDMGRLIKGSLKPSHALALFHDLSPDAVPVVDLDHDTALEYLRKNEISPSLFQEGQNLVTYTGYPVGWVKKISNRLNNLYPKELRIANL